MTVTLWDWEEFRYLSLARFTSNRTRMSDYSRRDNPGTGVSSHWLTQAVNTTWFGGRSGDC